MNRKELIRVLSRTTSLKWDYANYGMFVGIYPDGIYANDMNVGLWQEIETGVRVNVERKKLLTWLKKSRSELVFIDKEGILETSEGLIHLRTIDDYPPPIPCAQYQELDFDASKISWAIGGDRPVLKGIGITGGYACGANGYILAALPSKLPECIIDVALAKFMVEADGFALVDGITYVRGSGWWARATAVEGIYPNVTYYLLDGEPIKRMQIDSAKLCHAIDMIRVDGATSLTMEGATLATDDALVYSGCVPVGPEYKVIFSPTLLRDVVAAVGDCEMYQHDIYSAALFVSEPLKVVLMPMYNPRGQDES